MSQSLGNYVGVTDPPDEMFGKLMRIPDELIGKYLRLVGVDALGRGRLASRRGLAAASSKPNDLKRAMARAVVERYHGAGAGERAEEAFNRVHRDRELPEVVPEVRIPDGAVEDGRRLAAEAARRARAWRHPTATPAGGSSRAGSSWTTSPSPIPPTRPAARQLTGKVLQVGRRWFGRLA